MKMDIEGFEPNGLAAASAIIERFRFPIFMEFNSWCLSSIHDYSPFEFAKALWEAFEVSTIQGDGCLNAAPPVSGFLANNLTKTIVDDILIRLKLDSTVPSLHNTNAL